MHIERLVEMINQIADYWSAEPNREVAIKAIHNHVRKFWEQRMRKEIVAHLASGGEGLSDLALEAVRRLAEEAKAA